MNPLQANIKLFLRKPLIWFVYLILLPLSEIASVIGHSEIIHTIIPVAWMILTASIIIGRYLDILPCTTSFLLPGQMKVFRKLIFGAGIIFTVLFTIIHTAAFGLISINGYIGLLTMPALLWSSYLIAIFLALKLRTWHFGILVGIAFIYLPSNDNLSTAINHKIFYQLYYLIIICAFILSFK